ncbi:MAG: hypothetical protein JSR46_01365 [Verrucomicrobia bacterium]|nr:hypothetical protein [Verrucomicrobiota bacterium]
MESMSNQDLSTMYRDGGRLHFVGEKTSANSELGIRDYSSLSKTVQKALVKAGLAINETVNGQVVCVKKTSFNKWKEVNEGLLSQTPKDIRESVTSSVSVETSIAALKGKEKLENKSDVAQFLHHLEIVARNKPDYFDEEKINGIKKLFFGSKEEGAPPLAFTEKLFDIDMLRGKVGLQKLLLRPVNLNILLEEKERIKENTGGLSPDQVEEKLQEINSKIQTAKAELGLKLGAKPRAAGAGVNGTVFLTDPFETDKENQKVSVFKPPQNFGNSPADIAKKLENMIKNVFGQLRLLNRQGNNEQFTEVAAYSLSQGLKEAGLGMDLLPKAEMKSLEIDGKETTLGANIYYLEGFQPLSKVEKPVFLNKEAEEKFQILACVLWAMGQLDPHTDNIFVKVDGDGKIADCRGIDLGNGLRRANPGNIAGTYAQMGNLEMYAKLPLANKNIPQGAKEKMIKAFREINIDEWAKDINKQQGVPKDQLLVKDWVKALLKERCAILADGLELGILNKPADLANIRTYDEFTDIANKIEAAKVKRKNEAL